MSRQQLRRLFEHMDWADRRIEAGLDATEQPPRPALELAAHVLGAELVWLARIQGSPTEVAVWPEPAADLCRRLAERSRRGYGQLLEDLDPPPPERR